MNLTVDYLLPRFIIMISLVGKATMPIYAFVCVFFGFHSPSEAGAGLCQQI